jgi:hypothetical protein
VLERVRQAIEQRHGTVMVDSDVVRIERSGNRLRRVIVAHGGGEQSIAGEHFLSSMPITEFVLRLDPPPPPQVVAAAKRLSYRDFLTVCLIVNRPDLFPDNWIYIQDPDVQVGRIQNFKNWSPDMVPEPSQSSLGLEYFCTEGDRLWSMPDADLIELAKRELELIGLARASDITDGCVFRVEKAYPVYDSDYQEYLEVMKDFVAGLENFQTVGRNGLHRYNNQDHAMLTGMLAVRNVLEGERNDLWSVNADQEYLEEMEIPQAAETALDSAVGEALVRLDRTAFGLSLGTVAGIVLFVATLVLVLKGGPSVGPNLQLLGHFFPGYRVSLGGSFVGLLYGFLIGFICGWSFAFLRNASVFLYVTTVQRRVERRMLRRIFEYV